MSNVKNDLSGDNELISSDPPVRRKWSKNPQIQFGHGRNSIATFCTGVNFVLRFDQGVAWDKLLPQYRSISLQTAISYVKTQIDQRDEKYWNIQNIGNFTLLRLPEEILILKKQSLLYICWYLYIFLMYTRRLRWTFSFFAVTESRHAVYSCYWTSGTHWKQSVKAVRKGHLMKLSVVFPHTQ